MTEPFRVKECLIVAETIESGPDAIRDSLIMAGFTPDSAACAARTENYGLLVHTGRVRRVHLTGRKDGADVA